MKCHVFDVTMHYIRLVLPPNAKNLHSQSLKRRMEVRDFDNSLSRSDSDFVILAQPAGMVKPTEGALDNPVPRKLFPFVWLDFLRNVYTATQNFFNVTHESTAIACIGAEILDGRIALDSKLCGQNPRLCVVDVRRMDDHCKQISHHVSDNVPLSPFRFSPRRCRVPRLPQPF